MDLPSTIVNIKKWLKKQNVGIELDVPGQDLPEGLKHGVLFMDYLHSSQHFPAKLTPSEKSMLKVFAGLCAKVDSSASATAHSEQAATVTRKRQNQITKENGSNGKAKIKDTGKTDNNQKVEKPGPKKNAKKLAPLAETLKNMSIQENKGCSCKGDCRTKVCGCQKKALQCTEYCKCTVKCMNKKAGKKNGPEPTMEEEGVSDSRSDESSDDTDESGGNDLAKVTVDWERHLTSLVECMKCTRKFFPNRVQFHMQVCKGCH